MDNIINVAFQLLPRGGDKDTYALVDSAIEVIQKSGLKYRVCPFETVIEGKYDEIMEVIKQAQQASFDAGATDFLAYIKMQVNKAQDVAIEDKTWKYDTKNPVE